MDDIYPGVALANLTDAQWRDLERSGFGTIGEAGTGIAPDDIPF